MDNVGRSKLFHKDFTLMVLGQIISLFGNSILRFALSLYVLDLTGSAVAFGGILALSMIPTVLLAPLGGLLADRVNRRNIMVVLDYVTAAVILCFSFLLRGGGGLLPIGIVMVALSVIQSFYQPSVQASIPSLAGNDQLEKANGIVIQVNALASLLGPIIGGILYGFLGIALILTISGVCFFLSATMELFLRIPFVRQEGKDGLMKTVKNDLSEALHFLTRENPQLFKLLFVLALLNLFLSSAITVGMPYLIRIFLGLSSEHNGFAEGAMAVGSILGGLLAGLVAKKVDFRHSYKLLLIGTACLLPMTLAVITNRVPLVSYAVILVSVLGCLCCATLFNIFAQTFAQRQTPPHLLGKVFAFVSVVTTCAFPIGQALYGVLFDKLPSASLILFFACAASFAVALAAGRLQKKIPVEEPAPEAA